MPLTTTTAEGEDWWENDDSERRVWEGIRRQRQNNHDNDGTTTARTLCSSWWVVLTVAVVVIVGQVMFLSLGSSSNDADAALAFVKFFATPIENLDLMAATIMEQEQVTYDELIEPVRLLQEYEVYFWNAIVDAKENEDNQS